LPFFLNWPVASHESEVIPEKDGHIFEGEISSLKSLGKSIGTYHAPVDFMDQAGTSSPEEMKKGMDAWMAWAKKCGAKTPWGSSHRRGPLVSADTASS
jgi:hypothetical protein